MKTTIVKIVDPIGIHARPASLIVNEATKYKSDITFNVADKTANAKSLINLMSLGIRTNTKVTIKAIGFDEDQAINAIQKVMKDTKLI